MSPRSNRFQRKVLVVAIGLAVTIAGASPSVAAEAPVGLGTASSFAILAGQRVTNTGPSVISGNVGVSPGTAVTGFGPGLGLVTGGTIHAANATAAQAQLDLTTAYNDAAGRSTTAPPVTTDLGGRTLVSGVYTGATLGITGTLTLDGKGDPNAVFIFQAASTLITATTSSVVLINSASACNVFWQIGSSATLETGSVFVGSVLALTSISAKTGASIQGRLLARNGSVTLDTNTVTSSACALAPSPTTSTTAPVSASTVPSSASTVPTSGATSTTAGGSGSGTPTTIRGGTVTTLPRTGARLNAVAMTGVLAIVLGAMMLVVARRRAAHSRIH